MIRGHVARLLHFDAGNYPELRERPRDPVPQLRVAVKRFPVKPVLHRVHRVIIDKAERVGIRQLVINQPVAIRRRVGRAERKIRIRIGRIRGFKLFGKPCPKPDAANTVF